MSSLLSMMTSIPSLERRRSHLHCQCIMCWKDLATPIESAPDTQGTEEDKEESSPINNEPQQDAERDTFFNNV
ncbi:hypothetical protein GBAR_LOCUS24350 [Geodia barretti]|uniref:Uncharacterized protein n=1 Tax=Geodia barretti TaxID=519541 RepID=A0AA35X4H2_GEOBA|nr:hypothetical protein GBAR_LOCUS24350 [Geodia barretti]